MGHPVDRDRFAGGYKQEFGKALTPTQGAGCAAIFAYWEASTLKPHWRMLLRITASS